MEIVRRTGRTLFGDNCSACHGVNAQGIKGAPSLTTSSWLWGGDAETIAETIRVGINSAHPDARMSQMPAFGRDKMLSRSDIESVVGYVRTLAGASADTDAARDKREAGQALFAANCAACHGDDGKGKIEMGAPNLTDLSWIYGGDFHSVYTTVWGGRQGHMPTWEARLSLLDRKILTLYLIDLRRESP